MAAKASAKPHARVEHLENEVPVIFLDYGFVGEPDESGTLPVLGLKGRRSKAVFLIGDSGKYRSIISVQAEHARLIVHRLRPCAARENVARQVLGLREWPATGGGEARLL